ncbi:MAG: cation:proton antiporter [Dermatophilaceae bacterium]
MGHTILTALAGISAILGSLAFLITAIALLRVRDAVSRVNALTPATALGLPLMLVAALIQQSLANGWDWSDFGKVVLALAGSVIVSSVASNTLGRAAYRSGAPLDPATEPNELAGR